MIARLIERHVTDLVVLAVGLILAGSIIYHANRIATQLSDKIESATAEAIL
jgi:hypothetical protein